MYKEEYKNTKIFSFNNESFVSENNNTITKAKDR